jgi:hypothetical protein
LVMGTVAEAAAATPEPSGSPQAHAGIGAESLPPLDDLLDILPSGLQGVLDGVLPPLLPGPQLYVDPAGDDGNDGSSGTPLRTIQAALNKATPGTRINLAAGEYREQPRTVVSGRRGAPITIKGPEVGTEADGRAKAILYGTGRVFNIDHSYYTLEGFTIDGQEQLSAAQLPTDLGAVDAFKNSVQSQVEDSKLIYIGSADTARDVTGDFDQTGGEL